VVADVQRFRVGRHHDWTVYRVLHEDGDRDLDERYAVVFDPADGPRLVAALNAFYSEEAGSDAAS